jgi:hypothetical protein
LYQAMRGRTVMKYGRSSSMGQYSINAVKSVSAERAMIRWNLRVPVLRCRGVDQNRSPLGENFHFVAPGCSTCSSSAPVLHRDQHTGREVCHPNPKSGLSLHFCTFICSPATSGCMPQKSSQLCADPIPGSWLFGGLLGPMMPCCAASVRFWVSDTVPHLSTQGRSCTESAPVFLCPADLHASHC